MKTYKKIRYSNCWEDTEIVLKALNVKKGGKYLSISSAGDNALSILSKNPKLVIAIDKSTAQIACLEIKKTIFENLPYNDVLSFIGMTENSKRLHIYKELRKHLSIETRKFWDNNLTLISKGIIHTGIIENYFRLFSKRIKPLIMNKNNWEILLSEKSKKERIDFYNKKINSWKWNLFLKIVLNPITLKKLDLNRDSYHFKTKGNNLTREMKERIKYALTELPTNNNPYLEYIIRGNFHNSLPLFLKKENFEKIRRNLDKLIIFKGTLMEALRKNSPTIFDGFNLSDIFDYMSYNQYIERIKQIKKQLTKGGRIVYWNNLILREPPEYYNSKISKLKDLSEKLFLQNKAFFYDSLNILEAKV